MTPKQAIDKLMKCVNIGHYIGPNAARTIKEACYAQSKTEDKPVVTKVKPKPLVEKKVAKDI